MKYIIICALLLLCIASVASADACARHTDCESCTSDASCGWYAPTPENATTFTYSCVSGYDFDCTACPSTPHLYFKNHCPVDMKFIRDRRAIRKYLSRPIATSTVNAIIQDALWAPSAMVCDDGGDRQNDVQDTQATVYYVVSNAGIIKSISDYIKFQLKDNRTDDTVFYSAPGMMVMVVTHALFHPISCCLLV